MQRSYGLDLRVLVRDGGYRRLWALVTGLPSEAALWRVLPDEPEPEPARENTVSLRGPLDARGIRAMVEATGGEFHHTPG